MAESGNNRPPTGQPWWAWLVEFLVIFCYVVEPVGAHLVH
jgi:hypothetical protein